MTFLASADSSLNPLMLLKASSFCLSASLGLAIWSMDVMPASFIFFAVAGPIPLMRVRSDLSAGLAVLAATGFFAAGFLAAAGLALLAADFFTAGFLAAGFALVAFLAAVVAF